jgi:DNA invertase Pin-like site-specific DNA recombinase
VTVTPRQRTTRRYIRGWRKGRSAYGYLRVSTNQKTQFSLPDQRSICLEAAAAAGYTIVGWYTDERSRGVRRNSLVQMLEDLETNEDIGAVFFWQASRLWGHIEQQRRIQYRAQSHGVRLIDGQGKEWKSDTPMEVLFNLISGGINEFETSTTAERIHDTHGQKARQGKMVQKPPLGVRSIKTVTDDQTAITTSFVVDVEQMVIVRRIFHEYATGQPAWKIAKTLSQDGLTTQFGAQFTAANIRRTLDNRFYIGDMIWNRTKTVWEIDPVTGDKLKQVAYREEKDHINGTSPLGCILAEDPNSASQVEAAKRLFEQCQNQRNTRGRERIARKYALRVLAGLVICGRCGYRMQARKYGNKRVDGSRAQTFDFRCQHATNANQGCSRSHTMSESKIYKRLHTLVEGTGSNQLIRWRPAEMAPAASKAALDRAQHELDRRLEAVTRVKKWGRTDYYETPEEAEEDMREARAALAVARKALQLAEAANTVTTPAIGAPMPESQRVLLGELLDMLEDESIPLDDRRQLAYESFASIIVDNPVVTLAWRR